MSRYIDKVLLLKQINSFISTEKHTDFYNCGYDDCICAVQDTIEDMPEADVVEVVRCKDCKYYIQGTCTHPYIRHFTEDNNYCSYAERKNENEKAM